MGVLRWLSYLVWATVVWLFNGLPVLGLFLLSAHLFASGEPDAEIPAYVARGIASLWLVAATWHYIKHGIVQRPFAPAGSRTRKATPLQHALASVGCLATLVAALLTAVVAGAYADWAYAGLTGDDPEHPAVLALQRAGADLYRFAADPAPYLPWLFIVSAVLMMLRAAGRHAEGRAAALDGAAPAGLRKARRGWRKDVRHADRATAAGPAHAPPDTRYPAASAPAFPTGRSGAGRTFEAPMVGTFARDRATGAWRLREPGPGVGDLVIEAAGEPSDVQVDAARTLVQRSFEVLLRASAAAAPAAAADGLALPRFTIAGSVVHASRRPSPHVTVRLRDASSGRLYEVGSGDGMQTFVGGGAIAPSRR